MERQRNRKIRTEMSHREDIIKELNNLRILRDEPMSKHTSFRAGGSADLMIVAEDEGELCSALKVFCSHDYPHMVIGNGSNILVRDGGYRGAILKLGGDFQGVMREGNSLICGAAALLSVAAKTAMQEGLEGMEFASGIPGSMGGAVFMNAGAYEKEIREIIKEVRLIAPDGSGSETKTVDQLQMGYRKTAIQQSGEIVSRVILDLREGDPGKIRERIAELTARRNAKQPVSLPSAGSFFKRPEGHFAGKLIQDAGLKGLTVGGAQVSPLHAGFIVNIGNATATDILQLMKIVQAKVMDKFGVMLEPEVRIIGEDKDDSK